MDYIYSKLLESVQKVEYEGVQSNTALVTVDQDAMTIKVDITSVPTKLLDTQIPCGAPDGKMVLEAVVQNGVTTYRWASVDQAIKDIATLQEQVNSAKRDIASTDANVAAIGERVETLEKDSRDVVTYTAVNGAKTIQLQNGDSLSGYGAGERAADAFTIAAVTSKNKIEIGSEGIPLVFNTGAEDEKITVNELYTLLDERDRRGLQNELSSDNSNMMMLMLKILSANRKNRNFNETAFMIPIPFVIDGEIKDANQKHVIFKIPSIGSVKIGNNVEIGANSTIDRGTIENTTIGDNTKIDDLVMIGHNCKIGQGCLIVSQVGIAGSCVIGDRVVIAGQAGLADHIEIGSDTIITAKAGVTKSFPEKSIIVGIPAVPRKEFIKQLKTMKDAQEIFAKFRKYEPLLKEFEENINNDHNS